MEEFYAKAQSLLDWIENFSYDLVPLTETTRLTHIRLIHLTPAKNLKSPSQISLEIKLVPVDHPPEYIALSYAWGKAEFTYLIQLNGLKFHITPSLAEALLQLSQDETRDHSIPIWIDQLCINQSSIEERNAQVPLMAKIYSQAAQVLIWLGPAADGSDELMDGFVHAGDACVACDIEALMNKENWHKFMQWSIGKDLNDGSHRRPFNELCAEVLSCMDVQPLKAWFLRSWFHRVWIVQEYCLAKDAIFVCGGKSVSVDYVRLAWTVWQFRAHEKVRQPDPPRLTGSPMDYIRGLEFAELQKRFLNHLNAIQELHALNPITCLTSARKRKRDFDQGKEIGYTLFELLKIFASGRRQSTDPRDWIYGLLALPNDLEALGIKPDYNLSYDTVYAKYARAVIQNGILQVLRYADFPNSQDSSLPSWIPDWKKHPSTKFDYEDDSNHNILITPPLFHASLGSKVSVIDMKDEKLLALQGFIVDDIELLGDRLWEGTPVRKDNDDETLFYLSTIEKLCKISATRDNSVYASEQRRNEAIWRIPIGDLRVRYQEAGRQYNERASSECEEARKAILKLEHLLQKKNFTSMEELNQRTWMCANESPIARVYRESMRNMGNKRPFMTSLGYVGLGPTFAVKGDKVVVFRGGAVPFVVRGVGEGRYCVLGETYCDGIMDGEIVNLRPEETIVLV